MPAVVFPSPILVDQDFPRDEDELACAARTLGELSQGARKDLLVLALTETLVEVARDFNWTAGRGSIRNEIYHLLNLLMFQPHHGVGIVQFRAVATYEDHPIPEYCNDAGNVEFWAAELGKLVQLHKACAQRGAACAGVACILAFSGLALGRYRFSEAPRFPLVGPQEMSQLLDAFEWEREPNDHAIPVGYRDVCRNYRLIRAIRMVGGGGQGHDALRFKSGHKWPFSEKWGNSFSDEVLGELEPYTGLPLPVIRKALGHGVKPKRVLRPCLAPMEIAGY